MSASSNQSLERETFGPLLDISEESLILLATDIRRRCFNKSTSESKYIARKNGSYNIVHIIQLDDFKLVIRLPATGWGSGKTETAARAMESQVDTLRLIAQGTTIPVPEVYEFDTTDDNVIGTPYMCISFIPGKRVADVWFEDPETMTREQLRLNILKSLAQSVSQLSRFTFDKIGSVSNRSSTPVASGPCYEWIETEHGTLDIVASGPFDSAAAYLEHHHVHDIIDDSHDLDKAQVKILTHMLDFSPIYDDRDGFVLRPPDFHRQNIMVDEEGSITGIIDWDLVQTVPRCVGYAAYPAWIQRDWDPVTYWWPGRPEIEDSPETLERYREYYNEEMGKALDWKGDWRFTEKSHVTSAVWIALQDKVSSLDICSKFVQVVVDLDDNEDSLDLLYDIGVDEYEDWDSLLPELEQLVRIDP
ncbi:kinase-like protein [Hypoxylon sp. FL1150]|nr:kinase-like protein [Hypoxylon sp. FL1150]